MALLLSTVTVDKSVDSRGPPAGEADVPGPCRPFDYLLSSSKYQPLSKTYDGPGASGSTHVGLRSRVIPLSVRQVDDFAGPRLVPLLCQPNAFMRRCAVV